MENHGKQLISHFTMSVSVSPSFHNLLELSKMLFIKIFRFHDFRHTFATRLVQNGVDLYTVQSSGRWKTVTMVQRYARHNPESLRPGISGHGQCPGKKYKSSTIARIPPKKKGSQTSSQACNPLIFLLVPDPGVEPG
jgi:hypothetical protein